MRACSCWLPMVAMRLYSMLSGSSRSTTRISQYTTVPSRLQISQPVLLWLPRIMMLPCIDSGNAIKKFSLLSYTPNRLLPPLLLA